MDSSVSLLSNGTLPSPPIPSLPYCQPQNAFLLFVSSQFHACIPSTAAFISTIFGFFSIGSWLFAQLPQIITNYRLKSTAGLSFLFLLNWCFGDSLNFTGAVLLDQMTFQKVVAAYYVLVDVVLVGQFIYYSAPSAAQSYEPVDSSRTIMVRRASQRSIPKTVSLKKKGNKLLLTLSLLFTRSAALPIASVIIAGPVARMITASPDVAIAAGGLDEDSQVRLGRFVAWMSTALYLSSRAPQLYLNYTRKSVDGLSPLLFAAAFSGNFFYSTSLLLNPMAWRDSEPFGLGGWVGEKGNDRLKWWEDSLPFMLGAAGVLGMDGCVGLQFWLWGKNSQQDEEEVVIEVPEDYDVEVRGCKHDDAGNKQRAWTRFAGLNITRPGPHDKEKDEKECLFGGSSASTPRNTVTETTGLLVPGGRVRGLGDIDGDTVYGSTSSAGALLEAEFGKGCKGKGVGSP